MTANRLTRWAAAVIAALAVAGCAGAPRRDPGYAAARPQPSAPAIVNAGAIYQPGQGLALFEDLRARRVGDVLTIRLSERTSAAKKAATNTKKEASVDVQAPTMFGWNPTHNGASLLAASAEASREFSGEGDSSQSNSLSGNITVTVAEVLANGNLLVRGEKLLSLNQGHEHVRISGIVRPVDIASDNSVLSTQVADAQISYGGQGALEDSNRQGWMARFFNSAWWPF